MPRRPQSARAKSFLLLITLLGAAIVVVIAAAEVEEATRRITLAADGGPADGNSSVPSVSHDGRFVAFQSAATNLVDGDTNDVYDVFVYDRTTGATTRVSVDSAGAEADGASWQPSISADGRYVAFTSAATNLVDGDTNAVSDVFVHDRETGTTERVSVDHEGSETDRASGGSAISADGMIVVFTCLDGALDAAHEEGGLFVRDRAAGTTQWIAEGARPSVSADGRSIAFVSEGGIFVHDRESGETERVSVDPNGVPANADSDWPVIDAGGNLVAFHSLATNLAPGSHAGWDVYVHERATRTTTLVSVDDAGTPANDFSFFPSMSADGTIVVFTSMADNLAPEGDTGSWGLFVHDRAAGTTRRLPVETGIDDDTYDHAVSGDGRLVAFASMSRDPADPEALPHDVWGVFVHGPIR